MFFEERDHSAHQVTPTLHGEAAEWRAVACWSELLDDSTAPEEVDEDLECVSARTKLCDGELGLDLPTQPTQMVRDERYRKAALAVDEADDPLLEPWPFLLIDRTGRIVTAHFTHSDDRV
jgi:hypothetical protein